MKLVSRIDERIPIRTVFASTFFKEGLVSNVNRDETGIIEGLPEDGLMGALFRANPSALVISTGGTAKALDRVGYRVQEISDYTGWPEMMTGLVKSMQGKLYVGMLAHPHTESDATYMAEHGVLPIDMTLVNFYPFGDKMFDPKVRDDPRRIEILRQFMDVGGPTAVHTSRKGFLATAVTTRPEDYALFARDLEAMEGHVGLDARLVGMQHVSEDLEAYYSASNRFWSAVTSGDLRRTYDVVNPDGSVTPMGEE